MAIGYTKKTWVNGGAPALSADNLNYLDTGVEASADRLDALKLEATVGTETTLEDTDNIVVQDAEDSYKIKLTTVAELWTALWTKLGALIAGGTDKATPLDADTLPLADSAASSATKKLTWANAKSVLATAFKHGGSNEIATATPGANVIPKAGAGGTLAAGWIPQATSSAIGGTLLGANGGAIKESKMPDGATAVYSQDAWATTDSWSAGDCILSVSGGALIVTCNVATGQPWVIYKNLGSVYKWLWFRIKANRAGLQVQSYNAMSTRGAWTLTTEYQLLCLPAVHQAIDTYAGLYVIGASSQSTDVITIDWIWAGDSAYLAGSLSEEAARIANQHADTAGVGTKAQATLTSTGTAPSDADTVTIAGKVYTFKTSLGTTEGQILIGASAAESLDNLKAGVNSTGVSAVQYCAAQHPLVEATTNTDTTQLFEARTAGLLGNQITVAESSSQLAWANPDGVTSAFSRGTDDNTQKILTAAANYIAGSGTRPAAAKIELTNTSLIGYETTVDVASGATFTLPAGGTWFWNVYGYGATISSAKRGSSAGGTTLTVAGANASVGYRRTA